MNNAESGIRVRDGEDVIISPVGALLNQRNVSTFTIWGRPEESSIVMNLGITE